MTPILPLHHLSPERFETTVILKKLTQASRNLAELKGVAASIPNQGILINTLAACRTFHEPAANSSVWPIFQLLFDQ